MTRTFKYMRFSKFAQFFSASLRSIRKTKSEVAALCLSVISLIISSIAAYLSGPYSSVELSIAYEGRQWEYSISRDEIVTDFNITFINTGNKPIAITAVSTMIVSHKGMERCYSSDELYDGALSGKANIIFLGADNNDFVPFVLKNGELETRSFRYKSNGGSSDETKSSIAKFDPMQNFCTSITLSSVAPGFGSSIQTKPVSFGVVGRVDADNLLEYGGGEPQGNIITFRKASKFWQ